MKLLRLAAAAAAVCLLLTACEEPAQTSSGPAAAAIPASGTRSTEGLCPPPGPKVGAVLPNLTGSGIRTVATNPCVPFAGLVSVVMDVVTEEEPYHHSFRSTLSDFVTKVDNANNAVTCAYETDNLGIRVYQQNGYAWSVGLVVVIRDNVAAPAEIALCYLEKSTGFRSEGTTSPRFQPCWKGVRVKRGDETYTMLWAASSDVVCGALAASAS